MESEKLTLLIEVLAALEHDGWSRWQQHVHSIGVINENGYLVLPPNLIEKWEKQISTSYRDLSEEDKEKDRAEVRRYIDIIIANMHDLNGFVAPKPLKRMKVAGTKYEYDMVEIFSNDIESTLEYKGSKSWEAYHIERFGLGKTKTRIFFKRIIE